MNIHWNIETGITLTMDVISVIVALLILRISWKQYGLLFIISAIAGNILCVIFVALRFYTFPYRLFPTLFNMPFTEILTIFPAYVLLGVKYSPQNWGWKIAFYWPIIHLGMAGETWAENYSDLIRYGPGWNIWTSYTWWWIYFLLFEWIGGLIVAPENRKPFSKENFRYGTLGWFMIHFVLILTIFLAGYQFGKHSP